MVLKRAHEKQGLRTDLWSFISFNEDANRLQDVRCRIKLRVLYVKLPGIFNLVHKLLKSGHLALSLRPEHCTGVKTKFKIRR